MKKIILLFAVCLSFMLSIAQGSEDFNNATALPTGTTYGDGSFVGNGNVTWNYVHCQTAAVYPITGPGILLRRSNEPSKITATFEGGIGNFSVDTRKGYTGNVQRNMELVINGEVVGQFQHTFPNGETNEVVPFVVNNINVEGTVNLELRMSGATGNQHLVLDNIVWTGYGGGSTPPPPACNIVVNLDFTGYGDITTWSLVDGSNTVVMTGGPYSALTYNDFTITSPTFMAINPPYTLRIVRASNMTWCDNDVTYSVTVGGVQDIQGTTLDPCSGSTLNIPLLTDLTACIPSCPAASGLTHTQISSTSATLSWTNTTNPTELKWGLSGFDVNTGGTLVNPTSTSYVLEGLTSNTDYQFYVRQDCTSTDDGFSAWAGPYAFYVGYCQPTAPAYNDATGITQVTFGNGESDDISNTSPSNNVFYSNFTSISKEVEVGETHNLSVRVNTNGNFTVVSRAWIDWNNDGVFNTALFEDGGEAYVLGSALNVANGLTSASPKAIVIPNVPPGLYRLRVKAIFGTANIPHPCTAQNYSDTEDYTIIVINPCSETALPVADANQYLLPGQTLANLTVTGAGLVWYTDEGLTTTVPVTTVPAVGTTTYYVTQTVEDCTSAAVAITVTVDDVPVYCTPVYTTGCGGGDGIDNFLMPDAGINHVGSGCSASAYGDFTAEESLQGILERTHSYTFTATHLFGGQYLKIWIDFDNNGAFEPTELLFTSSIGGTVAAPTSGSIVIPSDVAVGYRRMRVMARWNSLPTDACTPGGAWGEAHDYLVFIAPGPSCLPPSNIVATNITSSSLDLAWTGSSLNYDIEWGPVGFAPGTGTVIAEVQSPYVVSVPGIGIYDFYVTGDCGEGDVSTPTGPYSVVVGSYVGGDIPTMGDLSANITVNSTNYCTPEPTITVDVPAGYRIASLQVQYQMVAHNGAWMSEQRSFIYSPTLSVGEANLAVGLTDMAGTMNYNRTLNFANHQTGSIDFVLRAWRTWSSTGQEGCVTYNNYVKNGTWVIVPTFELIPTCVEPTNVTLDGLTAYTADFSWAAGTGVEEYTWYLFAQGADPLTDDPIDFGFTETNSVTLYGLMPETTYDFYVTANCGETNGESGYSMQHTFTTLIACPAPTDLSHVAIDMTSATLSFTGDGAAYELKWGEEGFAVDTEGTVVNLAGETSTDVEGLITNGLYEFYVRQDCTATNDGYSVWAGPYSFYVGYCQSEDGDFNDATGITHVLFGNGGSDDIDNPSASVDVYYSDFTSISKEVEVGETYNLSVRVNTAGTWTVWVRAWIDWDNNGEFNTAYVEDGGEGYLLGSAYNVINGLTTLSPKSIVIPDVAPGQYRMRIKVVYGTTAIPDPCDAQSFAETEDYTIVVISGADPCADTPSPSAESPQSMTVGQTVADIMVEGENLTWYSDEELTTVVEDTTVLEEGSYTFYVTQTIGECTSEAIEVVVQVSLNTEGFDVMSFKAYPNPVKDVLTISYSKNITDVMVVNMLGQVVVKQLVNAKDAQVDMSALPTGNYVVKVSVDGVIQTLKVVKQ